MEPFLLVLCSSVDKSGALLHYDLQQGEKTVMYSIWPH